jgi:uncharacterized protein (TIGR00251 family)
VKKNNIETKKAFHFTDRGLEIKVFVHPRSAQCKIAGIHDGALKIKLTKPPVDGQANAECCKFLAKHLGVSKSQVKVVRGKTSRQKVLLVEGVSEREVKERL